MAKNRIKIPWQLKEVVWQRQKGGCALCLEMGENFHHILAVGAGGQHFEKNIILLCKSHHKSFHLGHPETWDDIYQYGWFLYYNQMPENKDSLEIAKTVNELLKKDSEIIKDFLISKEYQRK